jgi:hypothetical protein
MSVLEDVVNFKSFLRKKVERLAEKKGAKTLTLMKVCFF